MRSARFCQVFGSLAPEPLNFRRGMTLGAGAWLSKYWNEIAFGALLKVLLQDMPSYRRSLKGLQSVTGIKKTGKNALTAFLSISKALQRSPTAFLKEPRDQHLWTQDAGL